jgi:hypothetical protein
MEKMERQTSIQTEQVSSGLYPAASGDDDDDDDYGDHNPKE